MYKYKEFYFPSPTETPTDQVEKLIQFYANPVERERINRDYRKAHGEIPDQYHARVCAAGDTAIQRARSRYIDREFDIHFGQSVHIIAEAGCGKTSTLMTMASGWCRPYVNSTGKKFDYIFVISFGERDYEMWSERGGFVSCFKNAHPDIDIRVACLDDFYTDSIDNACQIIACAQDLVYNKRKDVLLLFDGLSRLVAFANDTMTGGDLGPGGLRFKAKQLMQLCLHSGKMFQPNPGEPDDKVPSLTVVGTLIIDSNNNNLSAILQSSAKGWTNNHIYLSTDAWYYRQIFNYDTCQLEGFTSLDPVKSFNRQGSKVSKDLSVINNYVIEYEQALDKLCL